MTSRKPLVLALGAGILAGIVFVSAVVLSRCGAAPVPGDCLTLQVSSSTEKAGLLSSLAEDYGRAGRRFSGGRCAAVSVSKLTSGAAMEAIASGWDEAREKSPAPQVWLPSTSLWLTLLSERADAKAQIPDEQRESIAKSPLVIAMPAPMAAQLRSRMGDITWKTVFKLATDPRGWGSVGKPEWGRFTLGKDNPHLSSSGMATTVATFYAGAEITSELSVDRISTPLVEDFVRGVEKSVLHYSDDAVKYMVNLAEADAKGRALTYVSAITVQEQLVHLYNQGSPDGDPAKLGTKTPQIPLVAVHPKDGTLTMDHPYVIMPGVSEDQRAAANDFLAFLLEGPQQARFQDVGFRNAANAVSESVAASIGVPVNQQVVEVQPPRPKVLSQMLASWDRLRKRARITLVLDVSGSMADPAFGGKSRLEATKEAAVKALDQLHPEDEVALWAFSDPLAFGGTRPYAELMPSRPVGTSKDTLVDAIKGLSPGGGTALYATVRAAHSAMVAKDDPERINAVVLLTDGINDYKADEDLDGLLKEVDAGTHERSVRIFTIAFGEESDREVLDAISKASRGVGYDARDPALIEQVFIAVLSSF